MQLEVKTMVELSEKNITPDFLYWVGSAGSFDDRAKKITRAFVKVLNYANVSFGVLGVEESTSGDVAKRAGNEFLFQMQALANIEVMNSYNIKKIITTCPHSFNILKNEYPDLGGNYEVYHHSEFVHDLIDQKKLQFHKIVLMKLLHIMIHAIWDVATIYIFSLEKLLSDYLKILLRCQETKEIHFAVVLGGLKCLKKLRKVVPKLI